MKLFVFMMHTLWKKTVAFLTIVWRVLRPVLGWSFIVLGLIGLLLPILQGTMFLVIGIWLVGRRNRVIRWCSVQIKLFIRRWASHSQPCIRLTGTWALHAQQRLSRQRRRIVWWMIAMKERRRQRHYV